MSREIRYSTGERAFVIRLQVRTASSENGDPYDGFASRATVYGYVGQNPLSFTDPTGEVALNPATGAAGGFLVCGPACSAVGAVAGAIALGVTAYAVYDQCKDDDDDKEKRCEENRQRDLETCAALGKRNGKAAYRICEQQAMLRYGNCLSGRDEGIDAPLPGWGRQ